MAARGGRYVACATKPASRAPKRAATSASLQGEGCSASVKYSHAYGHIDPANALYPSAVARASGPACMPLK